MSSVAQTAITREPSDAAVDEDFAAQATGARALLGAGSMLLRHRVALLRAAILGFVAGLVITIVPHRTYTSDFSFTPQEAESKGGLASIAVDLGLNLGGSASQSPEFYVDLLGTRQILDSLVQRHFKVRAGDGWKDVVLEDLLVPSKGGSAERRRLSAVRVLAGLIRARYSIKTNVVSVEVTGEQPELAQAMAQAVIEAINRFNSETRRTQSKAERMYAERMLAQAKVDLQDAERRAEEFVEQNRQFDNSPSLMLTKSRLDREVGLRNGLYVNLQGAYDNARLEEVRNTPLISIVEQPEVPALPDPRRLVAKTLLGAALAMLAVALWIFARGSVARSRQAAIGDFDEFDALVAATVQDLREPRRTIRALLPRVTKVPE
jgi:uncharacterized protein involved in exopolysaccharide biosynthesis